MSKKGIQLKKVALTTPKLNDEQLAVLTMAQYYFQNTDIYDAILAVQASFIHKLQDGFPDIESGTIIETPFGDLLVIESYDSFGILPVKRGDKYLVSEEVVSGNAKKD